jgi:hypothetical protein
MQMEGLDKLEEEVNDVSEPKVERGEGKGGGRFSRISVLYQNHTAQLCGRPHCSWSLL